MTDLPAILEGLPAWARGDASFEWHTPGALCACRFPGDKVCRAFHDNHNRTSDLALIGAMTAALVERGWSISRYGGGYLCRNDKRLRQEAPTLLAALAAACKVQGDK